MKVVIAGTRYKDPVNKLPFDDYRLVVQSIQRSCFNITEEITGEAIGVDKLGEQWAAVNDIPVTRMPVSPQEWNKYGKAAGPMRNRRMAEYCDAAIIIWDGISPGTRNMIDEMIRVKKPYYIGMTKSTVEDFLK
jgi:hypothetical protein